MEPLPIAPSAAPDLLLLLQECRRRGIRVSSDGLRLRLSGPGFALTTRLREGLRAHRASLVALLGSAGGRSLPGRPGPDESGDSVRELILDSDALSSSAHVVVPSRGLDEPRRSEGEWLPDFPDFPDETEGTLAYPALVPASDSPRQAQSSSHLVQERPPTAHDPGNPGASPLVTDTSGLTCSRPPRGDAGSPRWVPGEPLLFLGNQPPVGPTRPVTPADAAGGAASRAANLPNSEDSRRGARALRPAPWRTTLARWSIPWRQRWGDRANALQGAGLTGSEAEHRAFEEVLLLRAATPGIDSEGDDGPGHAAAGGRSRPPGGPAPGKAGLDPGVARDGTERRDVAPLAADARQRVLPLLGAS